MTYQTLALMIPYLRNLLLPRIPPFSWWNFYLELHKDEQRQKLGLQCTKINLDAYHEFTKANVKISFIG